MLDNSLLRSIPKVDEILHSKELSALDAPHNLIAGSVRSVLSDIRSRVLSGELDSMPAESVIISDVLSHIERHSHASLRPVINGTGVVLHTNLGRAPLADEAVDAVCSAACSYSTLEYDLSHGCRGSRYSHVEPLLKELTGAEAAVVVNNNAAAVLLILSALGKNKEAVVSRGELVEIGGSFRIPDIMSSCGCILHEVGTTNKTHLLDYENAINENTFALVKVHTSNFRVIGFSQSVPLASLAELAHSHGLPLIEDLGSGALYPPEHYGAYDEPQVRESILDGADIVSFSGDKLLGGPQAGIILGRKKYIDLLKSHPLMRAIRIDKMTLAALEATLRLYISGQENKIPVISMLTASADELRTRALLLVDSLAARGVPAELIPLQGQVGGGSAPEVELEGWGAAISCPLSPNLLESRLRTCEVPVIGRICSGRFCLDVRTMSDADISAAAEAIAGVLK